MPIIIAQGKTIEGDRYCNLRRLLLDNQVDLYNGNARVINCRGIGSCGTCAVSIEGEVSPPNKERANTAIAPSSFSCFKPPFGLSSQSPRRSSNY